MAMGRSWTCNSRREKLLILLAEDIMGLSSDPCRRSGWETLQVPIYSLASSHKETIGISKVTRQMKVCLPEGRTFKSFGHRLKSWLRDCSPHTAEGSMPATRIQPCAHTSCKWYALAALNSSLYRWIIWCKGWTIKYCVCLSKMERSWEIKRSFLANMFFSKLGSELVSCRQVQLSPLWDARWCFWLRLFFCSEHDFFPPKN